MRNPHELTKDQVLYASGILLTLLCAAVLIFATPGPLENIAEDEPQERINTFSNLDLIGHSVYVWDGRERRMLYGRNIDAILPLASLSKVMTALVADEVLEEEYIYITQDALAAEGDHGLVVGERWSLKDLIDFTLVSSSNDGARALAGALEATRGISKEDFITRMNQRARYLGLQEMEFHNPSGLDAPDLSESGAYGTVRDVVHLFDYILRNNPGLLEATREEKVSFYSQNNINHTAENTNEIVDDIPFLIASKTGYTDLAGGNLVIAFDAGLNHPVVIGVLGSTRLGRFEDIAKLYRATMDYVTEK